MTYKIIRFYAPKTGPNGMPVHKKSRCMQRGLTLAEAQRHCQDPKTRKDGKYFDGYTTE